MERIKGLTPGRRALDIACGEGRNSVFLARHGFRVTGVDISEVGLAKAARRAGEAGVLVEFVRADLDDYQPAGLFDLVVNFNFLLRPLIPLEVGVLRPGGVLLFDTILATPDIPPPSNPSFYLQPGELVRLFSPYGGEILWHEESTDGDIPTARLMFRKNL
jgi:SAM-dependent methyltransferase